MSSTRKHQDQGTGKPGVTAAFKSGLSRRDFLRQSGMTALLTGLLVYKPVISKTLATDDDQQSETVDRFTNHHRLVLESVQLQLFPADGDGPSAKDLNALAYLEWALTDPGNVEDGDRAFIIKGIRLLEALSRETNGKSFTRYSAEQQHKLMEKFAASEVGENWMSLLVYYLLESLLLDPVYGGNPDGIGWKWLEHQAGFPRPGSDQTYRHYPS